MSPCRTVGLVSVEDLRSTWPEPTRAQHHDDVTAHIHSAHKAYSV